MSNTIKHVNYFESINNDALIVFSDPELDLEVNQALGLDDGLLAEYRYGRKTNQNDDVSNEETQVS